MVRNENNPRRRQRRRGPRFTEESHAETVERLTAAAVGVVEAQGLEGLSIRAVADAPGLHVSRTAPLHYFGTAAGMLAAIAEHGFEALNKRLAKAAIAAKPGEALRSIGLGYAAWALERPQMYRAMHAAQLWKAIAEGGFRHGERTDRALEKAAAWVDRAAAARGRTFAFFVDAVEAGQDAGAIRAGAPDRPAHVVTTLVDGFLFHVLEEQFLAGRSVRTRLSHLEEMLDVVLAGLSAPAAKKPRRRSGKRKT